MNADDLGYDDRHTDAILECATAGSVTSATAMVYMAGSDRAAARVADQPLGVGLHLNLSEPFSAADVPAEVRETQRGLLRYFRGTRTRSVYRWIYDPRIQRDVDRSIAHQLERFRGLYGREPTHVDGHQHVHLCPNVFGSRAVPRSVKWRRALDSPGAPPTPMQLARRLRQHMMSRRPSTCWFFDIADVDPRTAAGNELLHQAHNAPVEVMAHPGFGHERVRLETLEWGAALAAMPVGSYADLGRGSASGVV